MADQKVQTPKVLAYLPSILYIVLYRSKKVIMHNSTGYRALYAGFIGLKKGLKLACCMPFNAPKNRRVIWCTMKLKRAYSALLQVYRAHGRFTGRMAGLRGEPLYTQKPYLICFA
jgi:hypothetical protein